MFTLSPLFLVYQTGRARRTRAVDLILKRKRHVNGHLSFAVSHLQISARAFVRSDLGSVPVNSRPARRVRQPSVSPHRPVSRIECDGHLVDLASEVERHLVVAVIWSSGLTRGRVRSSFWVDTTLPSTVSVPVPPRPIVMTPVGGLG